MSSSGGSFRAPKTLLIIMRPQLLSPVDRYLLPSPLESYHPPVLSLGCVSPVIADEELFVSALKSNEKVPKDLRSYIVTIWHQRCHKILLLILSLKQTTTNL